MTELVELHDAMDCITELAVVQVDEQKPGPDTAWLYLEHRIYALKKAWIS